MMHSMVDRAEIRPPEADGHTEIVVEGPLHPVVVNGSYGELVPLIASGMARGASYWTVEDVMEQARRCDVYIFVAGFERSGPLMIAVVRVVQQPRQRCCFIELVAGDRLDLCLEPGLAYIEAWAKGHGCDTIQATGREGWRRRRAGWHSAVTIWKEL